MRYRRLDDPPPGDAAIVAEAEVRALLADLEAERARWRQASLWALLPIALLVVAARLGPGTVLCALLLVAAGAVMVGALWLGLRARADRLHRATVAISHLRDRRAADVLAMVALRADQQTASVARMALRRVLRDVQAADRAHIAPDGAEALTRLLDPRDPDLAIAILNAVEVIGATRTLPTVRRYAELLPDSAPEAPLVRRALRRCIDGLERRAEEEREHAKLLRPAAGVSGSAGDLLRPAGATSGGGGELLRAVAGEETAEIDAERAAREELGPEG